jgi:DNA-binding transcriptional regulator YiaG
MEWTSTDIYNLRIELGMSQKEFAEFVRVRQATVSEWETGAKKPSPMAQHLLTLLKEREDARRKRAR